MAPPSPSVLPSLDAATIGPLLPACQRCRRLRRKCDTELPRCRACNKADEACTFIDGVTGQTVSRTHLQTLIERLKQLRLTRDENKSVAQSPETVPRIELQNPRSIPPHLVGNLADSGGDVRPFDVLTPLKTHGTNLRFWGSSSVFALASLVVQHACLKGLLPRLDDSLYDCLADPIDQDVFDRQIAPASTDDVRHLVTLYMQTMNCIYTFLDEATVPSDMDIYFELRRRDEFSIQSLKGNEAHQFFRISLMCAIACATEARHRQSRVAESLGYYNEALICVEEVTSEASSASLQALLLLILFSLFYPRKGEIWRLLDYACRLAIQLGYHKEEGLESSTVQLPEATQEDQRRHEMLRRSTFWALYALERIMGQLFGRGSDIPESIITIEYPSPLHNDRPTTSAEADADEHGRVQAAAFAHHYRLVYLRSEIFHAIYQPATPMDHVLTLSWLCERYADIHDWRSEITVSNDFAGYATLTCIQGYNQTLCFLFQPFLLRALRSLQQQQSAGSTAECVIVADSYHAASELLQAYQSIIRSPLGSLLGSYPLTMLSAHYIWLAASTLMAHALLAIDGRVRTVWNFRDWKEEGKDVCREIAPGGDLSELVDYAAFIRLANVASTLLHWCADRWPGMCGLRNVFEELFARLMRELVRKGLVT